MIVREDKNIFLLRNFFRKKGYLTEKPVFRQFFIEPHAGRR